MHSISLRGNLCCKWSRFHAAISNKGPRGHFMSVNDLSHRARPISLSSSTRQTTNPASFLRPVPSQASFSGKSCVRPRHSSECLIALLVLFLWLVCSICQGSRFFPTGTAPRHTAAVSTRFLPSLQTLPSFLAKCFYTPPPACCVLFLLLHYMHLRNIKQNLSCCSTVY